MSDQEDFQYDVAMAPSSRELQDRVMAACQLGYRPQGGIAVFTYWSGGYYPGEQKVFFYQADGAGW